MNLITFGAEDHLLKQRNQLLKLNKLIEWESFGKYLKGLYKYEQEDLGGGEHPYDPLKMLKATLVA